MAANQFSKDEMITVELALTLALKYVEGMPEHLKQYTSWTAYTKLLAKVRKANQ